MITQAQKDAAIKAYEAATEYPYSKDALIAAITAAVQDGEPTISSRWKPGDKESWNEAVERCAQVCDEAANDPRATKEYRYFCINMAAAIRNNLDNKTSSKLDHKFSPGAYLQMCAVCGLDRSRHPQAEG